MIMASTVEKTIPSSSDPFILRATNAAVTTNPMANVSIRSVVRSGLMVTMVPACGPPLPRS
jgi:hypothetical protein